MAVNIQHTLLHLEVAPPPGAWEQIAARLDAEYDAGETKISQKLYDFESMPPAAAWENITAGLNEPATTPVLKKERTGTLISFRRVAIAAAVIGLLGLAGWYFFMNKPPVNNPVVNAGPAVPATGTQPAATPENNTVPQTEPSNNLPSRPRPRRSSTHTLAARFDREPTRSVAPPENTLAMNTGYIPHADLDVIKAVNTISTPTVNAPPIRDNKGNIILDKNLITSADNNYIIVTGPNGEQTRISTKFLNLLGSLNDDPEPQDYFNFFLNENSLWKLRFREWKNKMLNQASFIPTATNFLDILELKDMLQDAN